jgi:subtilase family serine protease
MSLPSRAARHRPAPRPRFRPRLELLETRTVPSASATAAAAGGPPAGGVAYTPQQIQQAYQINQATLPTGQQATGAGQTIALIEAYHDPTILSDLATFNNQFGLAAASANVTSFTGTVNAGWATEEAMDVEWAHAVAPGATLMVVEAASSHLTDLLNAVDYASRHGASVVSMSWGTNEFMGEAAYDGHFTNPGVTYVASAGDGQVVQYPAASPNVTAVGGTHLMLGADGQWSSETAWGGTGGGPSRYESQPSYQQGFQSSGKRGAADVAYVADPSTGVYVYDSTGAGGWVTAGGTSAGAPQWAGVFALANQARASNGLGSLNQGQRALYQLPATDFHDITQGSNGSYSASAGYDFITGRGSPVVSQIVRNLATAPQPTGTTNGTVGTVQTANHATKVNRHDIIDGGTSGSSAAANGAQAAALTFTGTRATATPATQDTSNFQSLFTTLLTSSSVTARSVTSAAQAEIVPASFTPGPGVGVTYFGNLSRSWDSSNVGGHDYGGDDGMSLDLTRQLFMGRLENAATPAAGEMSPDTTAPDDSDPFDPFDPFDFDD